MEKEREREREREMCGGGCEYSTRTHGMYSQSAGCGGGSGAKGNVAKEEEEVPGG